MTHTRTPNSRCVKVSANEVHQRTGIGAPVRLELPLAFPTGNRARFNGAQAVRLEGHIVVFEELREQRAIRGRRWGSDSA